MRQCEVYINHRLAGVLTETDSGEYEFVYEDTYLENPDNDPVSLTMPLRVEAYTSPYLFAPFFNILTEGSNREIQAKVLGIDIDDDFGALIRACQDSIGAITTKPLKL